MAVINVYILTYKGKGMEDKEELFKVDKSKENQIDQIIKNKLKDSEYSSVTYQLSGDEYINTITKPK